MTVIEAPVIDLALMAPIDRAFFDTVGQLDVPLSANAALSAEAAEFNARFHGGAAKDLGGLAVDAALLGPDAVNLSFDNLGFDHLRQKDEASLAKLSTHGSARRYDALVAPLLRGELQYQQMLRWHEDRAKHSDDEDDDPRPVV